MSKTNLIRKKAQDYVRRRDWEKAIKEYKRLCEIEQHNPNLLNELGDLYLKVGNKLEAFKSFDSAIDSYARVSLYNNAVAVCKKVLRLAPNRKDILLKLGKLRKSQGLLKEAASYYRSYLEKLVIDVSKEPEQLKREALTIAREMADVPEVVEEVVGYLIKWDFKEDAAALLAQLKAYFEGRSMHDRASEIGDRISALGVEEPHLSSASAQNEWAKEVPSERERVAEADEEKTAPGYEYRSVKLGGSDEGEGAEAPPASCPEDLPTPEQSPRPEQSAAGSAPVAPTPSSGDERSGVEGIIDEFKAEVTATIDEEDFRSHYDLGMAYLEMELLHEAVREFQLASKSSTYRVRCLEMIGLCFLKQNQPQLAIKQLERGLALVGDNENEALGLRYNLGLAYEMIGQKEKAKACFEEVYMVDVSFRDIADKMRKYAHSS